MQRHCVLYVMGVGGMLLNSLIQICLKCAETTRKWLKIYKKKVGFPTSAGVAKIHLLGIFQQYFIDV